MYQGTTHTNTGTMEHPRENQHDLYWLEIGDEHNPRACVLVNGVKLVVGTDKRCDVVLNDRFVSARHCEVSCVAGAVELRDLGSKNGLFVGGVRLHTARLGPGACFSVGRVLVKVHAGRHHPVNVEPLPGLVGTSDAMLRVAMHVRRMARLSLPVLICGATGTGKELVARSIHDLSRRHHRPYCPLNVGAIPPSLAMAELFGHERGAFTDAQKARRGADQIGRASCRERV